MTTTNPLIAEIERALQAGQPKAAEASALALLASEPDHLDALRLLATALHRQNRPADAADALRRYLKICPNDASIINSLGVFLAALGQQAEAIAQFQYAASVDPNLAEAHNNMGVALDQLDRHEESVAAFAKAVNIRPNYAEAHSNLGNALRKLSRFHEAIEHQQRAIELNPRHAAAYHHLAGTLEDLGRPEEGIAWRKRLVDLVPDNPVLHSDLLWATLCVPDVPPAQRLAEHLEWGRRHAEPQSVHIRPHSNDRTPDRRLRVGYVSPNFGAQAVGWFMAPLIAAHDRQQVEVYGYSDIWRPDWMTEKIRSSCHQWRETANLSHRDLADLVRRDQIDILIDVRGHMAGHRLVAFAEKPAPMQMSYVGYQYTVGFDAIDYRICDEGTDPKGLTERWHVEQLARLPRTIWCYQPQEQTRPAAVAPVERNGYVTFGVFQKPAKLNGFVVELWSRILNRVPRSHLAVLAPGSQTLEYLRMQFHARGIDPQRIEALPRATRQGYLELFHRVDVALDSFPYAGVTTTCDAMWMGVPVLSLLGPEPFERAGASVMPPCGLSSLLAPHPRDYVEMAARIANDPNQILALRQNLRQRMQASELMHAPSLARAMEACFREAWAKWIAQGVA